MVLIQFYHSSRAVCHSTVFYNTSCPSLRVGAWQIHFFKAISTADWSTSVAYGSESYQIILAILETYMRPWASKLDLRCKYLAAAGITDVSSWSAPVITGQVLEIAKTDGPRDRYASYSHEPGPSVETNRRKTDCVNCVTSVLRRLPLTLHQLPTNRRFSVGVTDLWTNTKMQHYSGKNSNTIMKKSMARHSIW